MRAVRPTFIAVRDDAAARRRPAFRARGRMHETARRRVLDAFAEPIDNLCAGAFRRGEIVVGAGKVVALRTQRIGFGIGKDSVHVHDIRVRPMAIVQARERHAERALWFR